MSLDNPAMLIGKLSFQPYSLNLYLCHCPLVRSECWIIHLNYDRGNSYAFFVTKMEAVGLSLVAI